jgi:hypothetical protein
MYAARPSGAPVVEQISVFLENETGGLADVLDVLARRGVDLRALSLADDPDFGILRLIVNDTEAAVEGLKAGGFTVRRTPVVAVQVPDRPGGLAGIVNALRGIDIEYMYAFVQKSGEHAFVVIRFDEPDAAVAALRKAGATLLDAADVRRL